MVRAQARLVEALGIERLFAVVGGSMGGMQVLQWAADYPGADVRRRVHRRRRRATRPRTSPSTRSAARRSWPTRTGAAATTRAWRAAGEGPGGRAHGGAHHLPVRDRRCSRKFGRELQRDGLSWGFDADFQVESYLRHQGLPLRRPLRRQLLSLHHPGHGLFRPRRRPRRRAGARRSRRARDVRFCVVSFTSDWLYPTAESRAIVRALNAAGARASFVEIDSDKGHDAFLLDEPVMRAALAGFLESAALAWTGQ